MWDSERKFECKSWSQDTADLVTVLRLAFLPGKVIWSFVLTADKSLAPPPRHANKEADRNVGRTVDVPTNSLEEAASVRVEAAQADNAEVDLSQWSVDGESREEAAVRVVLRRFAAWWWSYYQEKLGRTWFKRNKLDNSAVDVAAVEDCIRRCKACTYWTWPCGSRILYWRMSDEWGDDFRDGVPFWKSAKPPTGRCANLSTDSREAELLTCQKVFKLVFNWYLRACADPPKLVILRFTVPKVVLADGTVVDVRCVWDCKRNGHNETLWAPSFFIDGP